MTSLISSGSCFIRAAMLRVCFGLLFAGMGVVAQTAQSEENSFAPKLEILTIEPVRTENDWLFPYRLDTNITLARPAYTAPVESGSMHTPRLHIIAEPKKETAWATKTNWQISPNSKNASLSPILRFGSEKERFEIKPRRNSIWFGWSKTFH